MCKNLLGLMFKAYDKIAIVIQFVAVVCSLVIKKIHGTEIRQYIHDYIFSFFRSHHQIETSQKSDSKSLRSNVKTRSKSVLLSFFLDQHYQDHTSRVNLQSCVQDSTPGLRGVRTRFRHCVQLNLPWSDAHEIKFT